MRGSLFEDYKAALRRGHTAALAGQLDIALQAYAAAAQLVPERALPHASQGTVLHRLDRWAEAAAAFDLALRLAPDDEAALRARGGAREERGLRSGAAADFERLAFVLDVGGRSAEAADAARRAADLEPSAARSALATRLADEAARRRDLIPAAARPGTGVAPADMTRPHDALDEGSIDISNADRAALAFDPDARAAVDAAEEAFPGITEERFRQAVDAIDAASPLAEDVADGDADATWPPIDLPSPPPPPIEGPPPDPEELVAQAVAAMDAGDADASRDLLLTAVMVHRQAGRLDAALELSLQLLAIAPGDPRVHLAIANLQLDRGWVGVATEKLELLVRLTSLTGDTQAEADVHGLAAERLRDDPVGSPAAR